MTTTNLSPAEKTTATAKHSIKNKIWKSISPGHATLSSSGITKSRRSRGSAASKTLKGSTFRGGNDPFHEIIVAYGEPIDWIEVREFESQYNLKDAMLSKSPPNPQLYNGLPSRVEGRSSGLDIDRRSIGGKEFWKLLGKAWVLNRDGEASQQSWETGGEWRKSVGTVLCEEREFDEMLEEEMLLRQRKETEHLGG